MHKIARSETDGIFEALAAMMNPVSSYKLVVKEKRELYKRLAKHGTSVADACIAIFRRTAFTLINKLDIPCLLKMIETSRGCDSDDMVLINAVDKFIKVYI